MSRVLVRADSSLVFGRGHLSRTKNVVTQLQHLGHSVTFAPSPPFDEYNNDLSFEKLLSLESTDDESLLDYPLIQYLARDASTLSSYINSFKPDLFIIDTPLLRASSFLNSLSFASDLDVAAFIDSPHCIRDLFDYIIAPSLSSELVDSLFPSFSSTVFLTGCQYAPISTDYSSLFCQSLTSQYHIPSSPRILLYFGTCPSHFLTEIILFSPNTFLNILLPVCYA